VLRDLVLMAAAPDRPELTGVSPQFRDQLPELAKSIGRSRLLQWQAQLRGAEQQLRQSEQPRLWLEVLLLGLLAEPISFSTTTATRTPQSPKAAAAASTPAATPIVASIATAPPEPVPSPAQVKAPELPAVAVATPTPPTVSTNLPELWQQILGSLELPSTRMLLSQQAQLVRLDANRAVVQVAGNWMGMVQSRASLLEQAVAKALGGSRQLIIEASTSAIAAPAAPAAPVVQPAAPGPVETETPQLPKTAVIPAVVDAPSPVPPAAPSPLAPAKRAPPKTVQAQPSSAVMPPAPAQNPANTSPQSGLDRQAKNLADFFNGQVLDVDTDGIG
jgi:DNA polymerase-3 subunit gamma/tau